LDYYVCHPDGEVLVLVLFLRNRKKLLNARCDRFDHVNLKELFLNNENTIMNLEVVKKDISFLYQMYYDFQRSYYSSDDCTPALSLVNFLANNFVVVLECKFQNDSIKSGSVDIHLAIETTVENSRDEKRIAKRLNFDFGLEVSQ